MKIPRWLFLSALVALLWGGWGALIEIPEKRFSPGFPATLGYVVWSITMIPCALFVLNKISWRIDHTAKAIRYGLLVGLLGAGGQLILFRALQSGPAYLVFPIVSLAPVVTIALSVAILRERTHRIAVAGVVMSLIAIVLLSVQQPESGGPVEGYAWLIGTLAAFLMWGIQAYFWKSSTGSINEESLFFYMALSAVALAPVAWMMTDFTQPINWTITGPWLTGIIHLPNSLGALLVIYAMRSGKAMIVSPAVNGLYPVITIVLSLLIYQRLPWVWNAVGMVFAVLAVLLMSYGEELQAASAPAPAGPAKETSDG